jgi:hypothetical protein
VAANQLITEPLAIGSTGGGLPQVTGTLNAYFSFDVAETIDLNRLRDGFGTAATLATLYDKAPGAPRVRYIQPPVVVDGAALDQPVLSGFRVRVKFYDYGVVSLALTRPFTGSWTDLVAVGQDLIESEPLQQAAEQACHRIVARVRQSLDGVRTLYLDEDYLVIAVTGLDPPMAADALVERFGEQIAQLLRGERQPLSAQEREEVLRHRLSYLADDLVVTAWNASLVYDTEAGAAGTMEVLEFANSQLLEFRYHDEQLEATLTRIYAELQHPRPMDRILGRRYLRATRELHSLLIDVNELTDRTENALKLVGDVYAARLFSLVAARLGLDRWKRNVQDKLQTLDDIYRFAVDQTRISQGNLLELIIVLILIFELGLTLRELLGWG